MELAPINLSGDVVRLEPLAEDHAPGLWPHSNHDAVWRWMPFRPTTEEELAGFIRGAIALREQNAALAFAICLTKTGEPVGATGFWNIDHGHKRVEIGATWVGPEHQRSAVNTEAKYLLLRHAFETLGCSRVEFKTDSRNDKSRKALARIGASEEGCLRRHMILPDGDYRDSIYFSVIEPEWPRVKERVEGLLRR